MKIPKLIALVFILLSANSYGLELQELNPMQPVELLVEQEQHIVDFSTISSGLPAIETEWVERPYTEEDDLRLVINLSDSYNIEVDKAIEIVNVVKDEEDLVFPTKEDILAIIAIESNFKQYAIHKRTKAKGLMQILYKKSSYNILDNIRDGVWLLKEYNTWLPKEAAIQAYNVGIGSYRKGIRATKYLNKYKKAKQHIERM